MAKWNSQQILEFLNIYEKYDVLWNSKNSSYRERSVRDKALMQLLAELNIESLTIGDLRNKIKIIKTVYAAELRKIIRSRKAGPRKIDIYKPALIWFEKANSFLKHVPQNRTPIINSGVTEKEEISDDSENIDLDQKFSIKKPKWKSISTGKCNNNAKHKQGDHINDGANNIKSASDSNSVFHEDELDHFGKYVTAMLRHLPTVNSLRCQQEIQNILTMERISMMEKIDTVASTSEHVEFTGSLE